MTAPLVFHKEKSLSEYTYILGKADIFDSRLEVDRDRTVQSDSWSSALMGSSPVGHQAPQTKTCHCGGF